MTYPEAPRFNSGERDSAWFEIRDAQNPRLVLTTGREAALRLQRVLLNYLRTTRADGSPLPIVTASRYRGQTITWDGGPPGDRVLRLDGSVGPTTLSVLREYLERHGRVDISTMIDQEIARNPRELDAHLLWTILGVAWNVRPELIDASYLTEVRGLPYNRRAPAPYGPGADIEYVRLALAANPGHEGGFTIVRGGSTAVAHAPGGQVRPDGMKPVVIVKPVDPYAGIRVAPRPANPVVTTTTPTTPEAMVAQGVLTTLRITCEQWRMLTPGQRQELVRAIMPPMTMPAAPPMYTPPGTSMTMGPPVGTGPGGGGGGSDSGGGLARALAEAVRLAAATRQQQGSWQAGLAAAVQNALRSIRTTDDMVGMVNRHCGVPTLEEAFFTRVSMNGWWPATQFTQSTTGVAPGGQAVAPGSVTTVERYEDPAALLLPNDPEPSIGVGAIVASVAVIGLVSLGILWVARPAR